MILDPVVVIIAFLLWLMLIIVSVILEESYAKRIPAHKLRFPRYLGAVGIGFPNHTLNATNPKQRNPPP
ncbi:MAG: hypothetical protein J6K29_10155 [Clostridia bacterium]|nr:hypothetical protein [Clostridia bacterium]